MPRRGRLLVLPVLAAALVGACTTGPEPAPRTGTGQPYTGPSSPTAAGPLAAVGPMTVARAANTATALPDGHVLLTGGYDGSIVPADAAYFVRP